MKFFSDPLFQANENGDESGLDNQESDYDQVRICYFGQFNYFEILNIINFVISQVLLLSIQKIYSN